MFDEEFRMKCLIYVIGAVIAALVAWVSIDAFKAFGDHILAPTYHFVSDYFRLYGRATAEVFGSLSALMLGLRFHRRVVARLAESFDHEMEHTRVACNFLREKFEETEKTREEFIRNEGAFKENLRLKRGEIGALQNRIAELETETLRLKNPLAVAAREASIARLEGELEILDGVRDARNRYEY